MLRPQPPHSPLPQPRKHPTQARSRALVSALEEACQGILEKEGHQALTINRLSEVSGVAVGSIYQYFPNKEAVITRVFERVLSEEVAVAAGMKQALASLPLPEALRRVLANAIRVELKLFRLEPYFHLNYYNRLEPGMRCGPFSSTREYVDTAWGAFIELYRQEVSAPDLGMAAWLMGHGHRVLIRSVLEDDPDRVSTPAFLDTLVNMMMGALRPAGDLPHEPAPRA